MGHNPDFKPTVSKMSDGALGLVSEATAYSARMAEDDAVPVMAVCAVPVSAVRTSRSI